MNCSGRGGRGSNEGDRKGCSIGLRKDKMRPSNMAASAARSSRLREGGTAGPLDRPQLQQQQLLHLQLEKRIAERQQMQVGQLQKRKLQHKQVQRQKVQGQELQQQIRQREQRGQQLLLLLQQRLQKQRQQLLVEKNLMWRRRTRHEPLPQQHQQDGVAESHDKCWFSRGRREALRLCIPSEASAENPSRLHLHQCVGSLPADGEPCDAEKERGGVEYGEEDEDKLEGKEEGQWGEKKDDGDKADEGGAGGGEVLGNGVAALLGTDTATLAGSAAPASTGAAAGTGAAAERAEAANSFTGTNIGSTRATHLPETAVATASATEVGIIGSAAVRPATADAAGSRLHEGTPYDFPGGKSSSITTTSSGNRTTLRLWVNPSPEQKRELGNFRSISSTSNTGGHSPLRSKRFCVSGSPKSALEGGQEMKGDSSLVNGSGRRNNSRYGRKRFRSRNRCGCPGCNRSSNSSRSSSEDGNIGGRWRREGRNLRLSSALYNDNDRRRDGNRSRSNSSCYGSFGSSIREVVDCDSDEDGESHFVRLCVASAEAVRPVAPPGIGEHTAAMLVGHRSSSTGSSHSSDSTFSKCNGHYDNWCNSNDTNGNGRSLRFERSVCGSSSTKQLPHQLLFPLRIASFGFRAREAVAAAPARVRPFTDSPPATTQSVSGDSSNGEQELCGFNFSRFSLIRGHRGRHQLQRHGPVFVPSKTVTDLAEQTRDGPGVAGRVHRSRRAASATSAAGGNSTTAAVTHAGAGVRGSAVEASPRVALRGQTPNGARAASTEERAAGGCHAAAIGTRLTPRDRTALAAALSAGAAGGNASVSALVPRNSGAALRVHVVPSSLQGDAARAALAAFEGRPPIAAMRPPIPQPFQALPHSMKPPGMAPSGFPPHLQAMQHQLQVQQRLVEQQREGQHRRLAVALRHHWRLVPGDASAAGAADAAIRGRHTGLRHSPSQRCQPRLTMAQAEVAFAEVSGTIESVLLVLQRHQQLFGDGPTWEQPQQRGIPAHVLEQLPTLPFKRRLSTPCSMCISSNSSGSRGGTGHFGDTDKCAICLESFAEGRIVRFLPCFHFFHACCVDTWLEQSDTCPICKWPVQCTVPSHAEALAEVEPSTTLSSPACYRGAAVVRTSRDFKAQEGDDASTEEDAYGAAYAQ